jgi:hypothetical protein
LVEQRTENPRVRSSNLRPGIPYVHKLTGYGLKNSVIALGLRDDRRLELSVTEIRQCVAKIDLSSLYPSVMIRYGICSRKDPEHKFLGVLEYMRSKFRAVSGWGNLVTVGVLD